MDINPLKDFPSINQVAHYFFNHYASKPIYTELSRKVNGWYVSTLVYEVLETKSTFTEKLWDAKTASYCLLKDYAEGEPDEEEYKSFMKSQSMEDWKYAPYYGYKGWDLDIIKYFGKNNNLSDTLLYGLARAYGNYAVGFFHTQSAYRTQKTKSLNYENASKEQVTGFIDNENKSIVCLKNLWQRNPLFQTLVGSIRTKLANEYVSAYMHLMSVKEDDLAKGFLVSDIYDDVQLHFAENYLKSCELNAILITNGDNDTFPLWYLQETKGFRKDVCVLNFSLASAEWYVGQLLHKHDALNVVSLTIPENKYSADNYKYLIFQDNKTFNNISLQKLIQIIINQKDADKMDDYYGGKISTFPTQYVYMEANANKFLKSNPLPAALAKNLAKKISWKINKNVFYLNDLLLLDLLATNNWERLIYFVYPWSVFDILDIGKYCYLEGMVYHFIPIENSNDEDIKLMTDKTYDLMMNQFLYDNISNPQQKSDYLVVQFYGFYRNNFTLLARNLLATQDTLLASKALDKGIEVAHDTVVAYDMYMLNYAECYYQTKQSEKANLILNRVSEIYKKDLESYLSLNAVEKKSNADEIEKANQVLDQIVRLKTKYTH